VFGLGRGVVEEVGEEEAGDRAPEDEVAEVRGRRLPALVGLEQPLTQE
jgi:hypothetical protein